MRSEVTLSADVEREHVLVGELVASALSRTGLRSCRSEGSRTGELLVEVEPHDFSRERQVLDGSPAGDQTELRYVEVRITDEIRANSLARSIHCADQALGSVVIANLRVAAEQAGRPVRIPVVVERATDAPGFGQMQGAVATGESRQVDCVRGRTETDGVIGNARGVLAALRTEDREARRSSARGDHVLGVALCPAGIELDVVAGTGRNVLDLQRGHH